MRILALDQGTTGSAALVYDEQARLVAAADGELRQHYPSEGHVEHDPEEIWETTLAMARQALERAGGAECLGAIGITNQRETTLVWERATGRPLHRAVVWQSRITAPLCEALKARGLEPLIQQKTGLLLDAYFSATKLRWLLDRIPHGQRRAEAGELAFGTVESWLIWKLTEGQAHVSDAANASRTMLFNLHTRAWDPELLALLEIPPTVLPRVVGNAEVVGECRLFGRPVPVAGSAGDQQAALFGQRCLAPGEAKNTYGTGCFLLATTGQTPQRSGEGLLATLAWVLDGSATYALEGSAFIAGAAVQWLRDGLGIIRDAAETEALAESVPDNGGVYLVPAFVGLGAPHWDMYARGTLVGLTRATSRAHLARAALEAIAYQVRDLAEAMARAGQPLRELRADGGGTANRFLMQLQADILGIPVRVAAQPETTALGAAILAGLGAGLWRSPAQLPDTTSGGRLYEPRMSADQRDALYRQWLRAVERARGWLEPAPGG